MISRAVEPNESGSEASEPPTWAGPEELTIRPKQSEPEPSGAADDVADCALRLASTKAAVTRKSQVLALRDAKGQAVSRIPEWQANRWP